jgi:hypothetical protein
MRNLQLSAFVSVTTVLLEPHQFLYQLNCSGCLAARCGSPTVTGDSTALACACAYACE